jgi:glycosyltransferase involved in cell wall biosynthesis
MPPTVSINLCCYNSEKYLRETLDSIVNQTYKDWELVIINDGSSDSTESIIQEYINQGYPIVYHYQKNSGLSYSRNEALKRSQGEYIAFIDHDDLWMPAKLEKQVLFFKSNSEIDFLYSNFYMMDQDKGKKSVAHKKLQPSGFVFEHFLYRYPVGILTALVRKSAFDKLEELFDIRLKLSEEYDVFMRILYVSQASYIATPLAVYRIHSNMASLRFMERYPDELEYISFKLKNLDKINPNKYAKALQDQKIQLEYLRAKIAMAQGELINARNHLTPHKMSNLKFCLLYCATYMTPPLWFFLQPLWQKGLFRRFS